MNTEFDRLLQEDAPPYLTALGLLSEPFADTASGHFYYSDAGSDQRLDLMLHLAPYSALLIIAGKPGVGKTTLLQQFVARANETWRTSVVTARVDMGRDELLKGMAEGFGLTAEKPLDYQTLYEALIAHLRALRQNALVPIVMVDDAQYLSAAMMELIRKLCEKNDNSHVISLMLFGTPQLQNLLESPALTSLAARITHTFEITPFSEEETARYIRHRFQAAGAADDGPFDAMLINKIHAGSGGIPDRINELARQVLMDKTLDGKERKRGKTETDKSTPGKRRPLMLLAAAVVVVLMVAGPLRTALFKPVTSIQEAPPTQTMELPPPLIVGEDERVIRSKDAETKPTTESPPGEAETNSSSTEDTKPLPPESSSPEQPSAAPQAAPPAPAPSPTTQPPPPPVAPPEKKAVKPETTKSEAAKTKSPPAPADNGVIRGEEWINTRPDNHYTLQLMALKEEKSVRQFIELHHLQDKAAYIPIKHDGQVLFTLFYGDYPSHREAAQGAKEIPAKWGTPNPWVRSFKGLKAEPAK